MKNHLEIFKKGVCTANRRYLLGSKDPPFTLRLLEQFPDYHKITHFAANGEYTLIIEEGINVTLRYGLNSVQTKLECSANLVSPISGTKFFYIIDKNKEVHIITPDGRVCTVPNTSALHQTGVHFRLINKRKLFLILSTRDGYINIYDIKKRGAILEAELLKSIQIADVACIDTLIYKDQVYLLIADFGEAYISLFDPENIEWKPKFTSVSKLIYGDNSGQMNKMYHFIIANDEYIVWIRYNSLLIFPIHDLFSSQKTSILLFKNIPELKMEFGRILGTNTNIPILLTKHHVVITTYTQEIPGIVIALSLKTGQIAFNHPLKNLRVISLLKGPTDDQFTLMTNEGALVADFIAESEPTNVLPLSDIREKIIQKGEKSPFISYSERILKMIEKNDLIGAASFMDSIIQPPKEIISYLKRDLELIQIGRSGVLSESYENVKNGLNPTKERNRARNQLRMRAFTKSAKVSLASDYTQPWPYQTSITESDLTKTKNLLDTFDKIVGEHVVYGEAALAIKEATKIAAPILGGMIGAKTAMTLFSDALNSDDESFAWMALWALTMEKDASRYDGAVLKDLRRRCPKFKDPISVFFRLRSAGMERSSNFISEKFGISKFRSIITLKSQQSVEDIPEIDTLSREAIAGELKRMIDDISKLTEEAAADAEMAESAELKLPPLPPAPTKCSGCGRSCGNGVYLFRCGHAFHGQCLASRIEPLLAASDRERLTELRLLRAPSPEEREEMDEIISQDCPICGMIATRLVLQPLVIHDFGLSF